MNESEALAELAALVAEYGAASHRERNYGSARFAHLFYCAAAGLVTSTGHWPPRPRLHLVGQETP